MKSIHTLPIVILCMCISISRTDGQEPANSWKTIKVHSGFVSRISAISRDEFLSAGADGKVFAINAKKAAPGEEVFSRPDSIITSLSISSRLDLLVLGFLDGKVHVLSLKEKKSQMHFQGEGPVYATEFSPTRDEVAVGVGNDIGVWNAKTGALVHQLKKHQDVVTCVNFSRSGRQLVSGGNSEVNVWNVTDGKLVKSHNYHKSVVRGVAFISDNRLASCSLDKGIVITDLKTGKIVFEKKIGHPSSLCFDEKTNRILLSTFDGSVFIFRCNTEKLQLESSDNLGVGLMCIAPSVGFQYVCVGMGNPFGKSDNDSNKGTVAVLSQSP